MHLTAAMPLLAMRTLSMALLPPNLLTNSTGVATCTSPSVLDDDDFKERDLLGVGDVPFSIAKALDN
jgi:hypothetical protein